MRATLPYDFLRCHQALREVWGYDQFRPHQLTLIQTFLEGQDCLGVLPTGGGKSLCFQVPAVLLGGAGLGCTLVVSPLLALMEDQVNALTSRGVDAVALHQLRASERDQSAPTIVYASPERLNNQAVRRWLLRVGLARVVVDEAHCISEWGHDFRTAYRDLGWIREALDVPIMALTATAPPDVADDIVDQLRLVRPVQVRAPARRANLRFYVTVCGSDKQRLDVAAETLLGIDLPSSGRALVYVSSRKRAKSACMALRRRGIKATWYHAGRTPGARAQASDAFHQGRSPVMVATTAWGMGIDRPDVRAVIHLQAPASPAAWAQEAGRAGRDGLSATAMLLIGASDRVSRARLVDSSPREMEAFDALMRLCERGVCRQVALAQELHGAALADDDRAPCGLCDFCLDPEQHEVGWAEHEARAARRRKERLERRDREAAITLNEAQKGLIVAYVGQLRRPASKRLVAMGLRGSRAKEVQRRQLDILTHSGALKGVPQTAIERAIEALLRTGELAPRGRKYPTVWLPDKPVRPPSSRERRPADKTGLRGALKNLRRREARRRRLRPYQVFTDAVIDQVLLTRPQTDAELAALPGIGPSRLAKYGQEILELVRQHPHEEKR